MVIYVIGMLVSSKYTNFDDVFSCELAANRPSMFCADGQMKISKGKSILKKNMQVTISERNCSTFDTVIYDVSTLLWYSAGHLPKWKSRVFVDTFKKYVKNALELANGIVSLIATLSIVSKHQHACREQNQVGYTIYYLIC